MRRTAIFLYLLIAFTGLAETAKADKKVALVIGNAEYRKVSRLVNPTNDAADIDASFKRLGFAVTRVTNTDYDVMRRAIGEFTRQARGADIAVVFYSGHGMEIAGENWLIPVDAELQSDTEAETQAINLKTLTLAVTNTTSLGLVMLDACRNNPFAAKMQRTNRTRAVDRGFARVEPNENVLVAYAAKDGTTAADGSGRNSPFSKALLQHIETPGLEIMQLFRTVRDEVMTATNSAQQPFVYGSLSRKLVYFKAPAADGAPTTDDEVKWRTLKEAAASAEFDDLVSPQVKRAAEARAIEQFLREFPKSKNAFEAAARLQALAVLLKADPVKPVVTEEEAAWKSLLDVRSGKMFAELSVPKRLEAESRGLEEFKSRFPQSRHQPEIANRLAELKVLMADNPSPSSEEEIGWRALNELQAGRMFQTMPEQQRLVVEASSLEEFMRRFPKSQHLGDARERLARLEKLLTEKLQPSNSTAGNAPIADETRLVASLRARPADSITSVQRERLADIAGRRARLDLEIPFDYNSAVVSPQALAVLRALGRVLSQSEFKGNTFLVGGHTDAAGNGEYNQDLSERRAEAVKRWLIAEFGFAPANFIAVGFGKERLKDKNKPLASENRRVEVVNMNGK